MQGVEVRLVDGDKAECPAAVRTEHRIAEDAIRGEVLRRAQQKYRLGGFARQAIQLRDDLRDEIMM